MVSAVLYDLSSKMFCIVTMIPSTLWKNWNSKSRFSYRAYLNLYHISSKKRRLYIDRNVRGMKNLSGVML